MSSFQIGRYFEDFQVGEVIDHSPSKTIFESDNKAKYQCSHCSP